MRPTLLDMIIKAESEEKAMENITYIVSWSDINEEGNYISNHTDYNYDYKDLALDHVKWKIVNNCKNICLWAKYPEKEQIALCQYTDIMHPCFMISGKAYNLLSGDDVKYIYDAIREKYNI